MPLEVDATQIYSKPFFDVQMVLAQKIAEILREPLEQVLVRYTAFYRIFGLDWSLDPSNPVWQAYIQTFYEFYDV